MENEEMPNHHHAETRYVRAVRDLLPVLHELVDLRPIPWEDMESDMCLIGVHHALLRQLESLNAALQLADHNLGHLAVGSVRPACEEFLWLQYLASLDRESAHDVFMLMAINDSMRSAAAMRGFVGDAIMTSALGFPPEFVQAIDRMVARSKKSLGVVGGRLDWPPNRRAPVPSTRWIAESVNELALYDYLYAASSRAVHFSAGEAVRRAWGDPRGHVRTDVEHHREYLSDFALFQLVKLFFKTLVATKQWNRRLEDADAERESNETELSEIATPEAMERVSVFAALPSVPLVLASEYELMWKDFGAEAPTE